MIVRRSRVVGLAACGLLLAAYAATTVFGVYVLGPARVWIVAAAALGSAALAIWAAARPLAPEVPWRMPLLALLLVVAASGNFGWSPAPQLDTLFAATTLVGPCVLAAAAVAWARAGGSPSLAPACLALAAVPYAATILTVPTPYIDVWHDLQVAGDALVSGQNPYATPIPDFYRGTAWYGFDAPGFPYPPVVLYAAALARATGLDVRWPLLACLLAGGVCARQAARRAGASVPVADLILGLWLFVPRIAFVVRSGHSEPISGLLLAAAVWALAASRRRAAIVLFGLFASSKQYLVVTVPLLLLVARTPAEMGLLAAGALLPWLPFLAWSPTALWEAAFAIHLARPIRHDSLHLGAWLYAHGLPPLPRPVALVAGGLVAALAGARRPGPAMICLGLTATLFVTLFLGPQAFGNYFTLTAWCAILALGC